MIINIIDSNINDLYKTYFKALNVDYTEQKSKFIIDNTIKYNKIIPLPYSVCHTLCEQIIYFLQLLKQNNYSIIDFNPKYFEIGYTSSKINQDGGAQDVRIEDKEMNVEFHGDENMYLETNIQIPFIVLKNTQLIVPINPQNNTFIIRIIIFGTRITILNFTIICFIIIFRLRLNNKFWPSVS